MTPIKEVGRKGYLLGDLRNLDGLQDYWEKKDPAPVGIYRRFVNKGQYCNNENAERAAAGELPLKSEYEKIKSSCPLNKDGTPVGCAQCLLLNKTKEYVAKKYTIGRRHPYIRGSRGDCGGGVGNSICSSGLPFLNAPKSNSEAVFYKDRRGRTRKSYRRIPMPDGEQVQRYAIDYLQYLRALGWKELTSEVGADPEKAPPGAVMVFAGPCTDMDAANGKDPGKLQHCSPPGANVGHVGIASDEFRTGGLADAKHSWYGKARWTYTDGRTRHPAVRNRRLVGVFVPGAAQNRLCGDGV